MFSPIDHTPVRPSQYGDIHFALPGPGGLTDPFRLTLGDALLASLFWYFCRLSQEEREVRRGAILT